MKPPRRPAANQGRLETSAPSSKPSSAATTRPWASVRPIQAYSACWPRRPSMALRSTRPSGAACEHTISDISTISRWRLVRFSTSWRATSSASTLTDCWADARSPCSSRRYSGASHAMPSTMHRPANPAAMRARAPCSNGTRSCMCLVIMVADPPRDHSVARAPDRESPFLQPTLPADPPLGRGALGQDIPSNGPGDAPRTAVCPYH